MKISWSILLSNKISGGQTFKNQRITDGHLLWDNLFVYYEDVSLPKHIQIGLIKSLMTKS